MAPNSDGRLLLFGDRIGYEQRPGGKPQHRLIAHVRTHYRSDNLETLLPLGELESLGLPGESYTLAFTPGLLTVYRREPAEDLLPDPDSVLETQATDGGGYVTQDGGWWIPSGRTYFDRNVNVLDPAITAGIELATARWHFYLVRVSVDAFGHASHTDYDAHDLLIVRTSDALGNTVAAENDYRVLQPWLVTDPNRNRTAAAFDALGVTVAVTRLGKDGAPPDGIDADISLAGTSLPCRPSRPCRPLVGDGDDPPGLRPRPARADRPAAHDRHARARDIHRTDKDPDQHLLRRRPGPRDPTQDSGRSGNGGTTRAGCAAGVG